MVERTAEVNEILRLLGSRSGNVVGICGMGGLGKTVLALAVAWRASVARQVIWLDIGETPDCLALINILIKVLGGTVSFTDVLAAQAWVKTNTVCMHIMFFFVIVILFRAILQQTIFSNDL